ncbi:hypothetical protein [Arenibaculum pallidiluteum]|uniref:hypothetical protein n=1 Tax=Arenibaculum pallidiluteum TaxID=2812559 RepID=UPI001A95E423|nr:hypothetical protein [Arenibaculum pallidiluteum]
MIKLGTRVRVRGREGMLVARTLSSETLYDVRFPDGTVTKYLRAVDLERWTVADTTATANG